MQSLSAPSSLSAGRNAVAIRPRRARCIAVQASLQVGDKAPNFALPNQDGKVVKLSSVKKPAVLFFYPADNTPGCTKEACAFRDSYSAFAKAGASVIGISSDDADTHAGFADKYELPFTLLTDEGDEVRDEFGIPKDLFGLLKGRQTFVIDKSNTIQMVFNNQFDPEKHVKEALEVVAELTEKKQGGGITFPWSN